MTGKPTHRKLVLTGGPCAGKSTIADMLGKAFPDKVVVVPEAASILYRGGFPRWPDLHARCAFQSAVFRVQREHEFAYFQHFETGLLVLDRGTVDGAAYWPKGPEDFFRVMGTTSEAELARYDSVIYLESADAPAYEQHRTQNPSRCEEWKQAKDLDEKTRGIWANHPNIAFIKSEQSFVDKVAAVIKVVEDEVKNVAPLKVFGK